MRRFTSSEISIARMVEPSRFLGARGFDVHWDANGCHGSVIGSGGREAYRVSNIDGNYVFCTHDGEKVGRYSKNIDLLMQLDQISFLEAVGRLLELDGAVEGATSRVAMPAREAMVTLPPEAGRERGREYLAHRGISAETILEAERQGLVRYCADGVLFVGYDRENWPRCATKRATGQSVAKEAQKRDLLNSNKLYCPIFSGCPETLYIVEGGVDALALRDLAMRRAKRPPTAIISGGAMVRKFLANDKVKNLIANAERICVMCENESSEITQGKTDRQHALQADEVRALAPGGCQVMVRWPRAGSKDVAEQNRSEARESVLDD